MLLDTSLRTSKAKYKGSSQVSLRVDASTSMVYALEKNVKEKSAVGTFVLAAFIRWLPIPQVPRQPCPSSRSWETLDRMVRSFYNSTADFIQSTSFCAIEASLLDLKSASLLHFNQHIEGFWFPWASKYGFTSPYYAIKPVLPHPKMHSGVEMSCKGDLPCKESQTGSPPLKTFAICWEITSYQSESLKSHDTVATHCRILQSCFRAKRSSVAA